MKGENFSNIFYSIIGKQFSLLFSDNGQDEQQGFSLSTMIPQSWSKMKYRIEHFYTITGLVLSFLPEIWGDVAERLDGETDSKHLKSIWKSFLIYCGRNLTYQKKRLDPIDFALAGSKLMISKNVTFPFGIILTQCHTLMSLDLWPTVRNRARRDILVQFKATKRQKGN